MLTDLKLPNHQNKLSWQFNRLLSQLRRILVATSVEEHPER